jgi:hypothetical protein
MTTLAGTAVPTTATAALAAPAVPPDTGVLLDCERAGWDCLAAGLTAALAGGPVPVVAGWAAVAADQLSTVSEWRIGGRDLPARAVRAIRRPHRLPDAEGIAILRVSAAAPATGAAGAGPAAGFGLRLAAARLGTTRRMLEHAVAHLGGRVSGNAPLLQRQLLQGMVADAAAAVELSRVDIAAQTARPGGPAPAAVDGLHTRIGAVDWLVISMFGASGFVADHPVRCLYVSELLRNLLVAPAGTED